MGLPDPAATNAARSDVDALTDDLEAICVRAVALTSRALTVADPGFELTFSQWRAVLVLGERREGARIGEVATRVGVTLPATSRLLRRLERRGLTALSVDESDRRATRARLTDRGHAVRETILAYRRAVLGDIAEALPRSERARVRIGLRAIAVGLEPFE